MPIPAFDVIVIGAGGMGAATTCELAKRRRRVLALEQFALGHNLGSSHGQTRIIRQAYYEHPDYVPLVKRAFQRWYELEQLQGVHLLTGCDCLSIGHADSELVIGVQKSAIEHHLPIEFLGPDDLSRRFPPFRFGPEFVAVLEHSAGFLQVERCVSTYLAEAKKHGAAIRENERVLEWKVSNGGVELTTERGQYHAAKLILTAGPWAAGLLANWGAPLKVMRQVPMWFEPSDPDRFRRDVFPIFIADTPMGTFYGLPMIDPNGVKIAQHYGAPELDLPESINRSPTTDDELAPRQFLRMHIPHIQGTCLRAAVCIYTLSPDRHFIIDVHPEHPEVIIATGFSGHGFKFASVVGEILADLAEKDGTALPVGRFGMRRFAHGQ